MTRVSEDIMIRWLNSHRTLVVVGASLISATSFACSICIAEMIGTFSPPQDIFLNDLAMQIAAPGQEMAVRALMDTIIAENVAHGQSMEQAIDHVVQTVQ